MLSPPKSIKTRLIAAVSSLVIVIIVIISYITLSYFEKTTKDLIANEQFTIVSLLANEIDHKLSSAHHQLISLSNQLDTAHLNNSDIAQDSLDQNVQMLAVFNNGIFLFDNLGRLVAETPIESLNRRGKSFAFREYLSTTFATKKPYIGDPYISSRKAGHPAIMLTSPIFSSNGELIGVLGGSIDLLSDNMFSNLTKMKIGKTGYVFLVTKDRNLILHADLKRIMKNDIPPGANKLLERAILGFEGTEETINSRGLHSITSFKHLESKEWIVAANFPTQEAYASIYKARKILLIVAIVVAICLTIVVRYLMNSLTKPLVAFIDHIESIPDKTEDARLLPVTSNDEIGTLTQAFNMMVTDLGIHHHDIETEKEKLSVTLRSMAEGVIVTDFNGDLALINQAAENMTGWTQEEAFGVPLQQLFSITDKERKLLPDPVNTVITDASLEALPITAILISRNSAEHLIAGSCSPLKDSKGNIIGAVLVFHDITEKQRAEDEILRLNAELEQRVMKRTEQLASANESLKLEIQHRAEAQEEISWLNEDLMKQKTALESAHNELKKTQSRILQQEKMASIGQLAAGVAHEINNPMGFLISNLTSLQKYSKRIAGYVSKQTEVIAVLSKQSTNSSEIIDDLKTHKSINKVDRILNDFDSILIESMEGADRVKKIVQDLKSFSRVDEAEFKSADINACIDSTLNIIWNEIKYNVSLTKEYGVLPLVNCNSGQLNQVFMNIIINGAQAIQSQGEITIKTWCDNKNILVSISDNGTGIAEDKMDRIFDPFFTTKEVGKGTGLGLSIAYDIIKSHKGEIKVESELGKGTTFTIIIPIVAD